MRLPRTCVLLLPLLLGGCGSFIARGDSAHLVDADYYKGTQADWQLLTDGLNSGYAPLTLFCWMSLVCPVATLASIPLDLVVDTALLPHDHTARP
ncbi:hypothetical protein PSm6_01260 [Pseudomonas solani]|uniref:YceK/YidQ family lipoprotein n=1 Tax=Pseudomonas solani TaxID=2731552 RepID=A0AAU7XXV7_9PSED|nr:MULTISPECIES: YceK/YidQ family lipoprotein [Pseudomonas]EQM66863.1 hypothetical protein L682_24385 [Pseudomonas alcaligenes OT 69]MDN4148083.1 YceK/YidQ family lipoprotein [Pseudomonas tohonis]WCD78593.1 YceK/YidQ family lipoprotein [Pseudomonas sp. TUM22785]BCD83719.1 hypothetical protein PSm6_01260 [Pseudomonas solani]